MTILIFDVDFQEDVAFKQKQREDKKALEDLKKRTAGQKGPLSK